MPESKSWSAIIRGLGAASLQQRCLVALRTEPTPSVSALAGRLGSPRPSLSRALHVLEGRGLVTREGRRWMLTPAGQSAAEEVPAEDRASSERAATAVSRVFRDQQLWRRALGLDHRDSLAAFATPKFTPTALGLGTIDSPLFRTAASLPSFPKLVDYSSVFEGVHALAALAVPRVPGVLDVFTKDASSLVKSFAPAIEATLGTQKLQLAYSELLAPPLLARFTADLTMPTSKLLTDLTAMSALSDTFFALRSFTTPLLSHVAEAATAHHSYVRDSFAHFAAASQPDWLTRSLTLPTFTAERFVGGARHLLEDEDDPILSGPLWDVPPEERVRPVEASLAELGPRFTAMWRGAWHALGGDGPDASRQAAHSGREVLSQVLAALAPDDAFTAEEIAAGGGDGRVTRAMRVMRIARKAGGQLGDWIRAQCKCVNETYALLSAEAHTREDAARLSREGLAGVLESVGGLVRVLIETHKTSTDTR